jgi:hypothetical protein
MDPDAYDELHAEIATTDGMRERSPPTADHPEGGGASATGGTA